MKRGVTRSISWRFEKAYRGVMKQILSQMEAWNSQEIRQQETIPCLKVVKKG